MKKEQTLTVLKLLKMAGYGFNTNLSVSYNIDGKEIKNFMKFGRENEYEFSEDELFDIYYIIHQLQIQKSNYKKAILYLLRSIKYQPDNEVLRGRYLNLFLSYISSIRFKIKDELRIEIFKEFLRFKEYSKMVWGGESNINNYSEKIIKELDCEMVEQSTKEIEDFINDWIDINQRYRPDEQALDYASQLIYKLIKI